VTDPAAGGTGRRGVLEKRLNDYHECLAALQHGCTLSVPSLTTAAAEDDCLGCLRRTVVLAESLRIGDRETLQQVHALQGTRRGD
jgi:hypothetical protein